MTEMALQAVMALAFVIFLIFGFSFVYRKRQKGSNLISLVAYQSFGQKVGIAAVRVSNEILVLGVTPSDIKLLKELPDTAGLEEGTPGIADKVKKLRKMKEEI